VFIELQNFNWIRNLRSINSDILPEEFTMLFMALSHVVLNDQSDVITWRWTLDGNYTVASTYECQFKGSIIQFPAKMIWKAATEPKCKFFAWLVLHHRVLIALNLIKRNWPCNANCALCLCMHETTEHLILQCNYMEAV
jgi:hypothetical protein